MFNAVAQLVVGVPLELQHGARRTAVVYVAGIFAGQSSITAARTDCNETRYMIGYNKNRINDYMRSLLFSSVRPMADGTHSPTGKLVRLTGM